jgi:hypothetical protein
MMEGALKWLLRRRTNKAIAEWCQDCEDDGALDRALTLANALSALGDCSYQPPFAGAYCGFHKAFQDEGKCSA